MRGRFDTSWYIVYFLQGRDGYSRGYRAGAEALRIVGDVGRLWGKVRENFASDIDLLYNLCAILLMK
jgi:hypothetical protein